DIQENLYQQALKYRKDNTRSADNYDELKKILEENGGFILSGWCGSEACETKIKDETKATIRVISEEKCDGKCIMCGEKAQKKVYFAKAY
ncbi:MAG: proline--tRNA ligase, partial [Candidatus Gracilibacteria bacterium]